MKNKNLLLMTIALLIIANYTVAQVTGTFTDLRDGKIYKTIVIGTQTWMAENLAYSANSGCWAYDNSQSNVSIYGYLYKWETAQDVCPEGWHLPSDAEWTILIDYLGGKNIAGGKMKEIGTKNWITPNTGGNNSCGFNGLPGGLRDITGIFGGKGDSGVWWSLTENSDSDAYLIGFVYNSTSALSRIINKEAGFSVRCVKNN